MDNLKKLLNITHIRNQLLIDMNSYLLSDNTITPEQEIQIELYCHELREFINNNKALILEGNDVDFPELPNFINLSFFRHL